jgi:hypothetical protein
MRNVTIRFADPENEKKECPLNPNPMYLEWLLRNPDKTLIGDKLEKKKSRREKLSDSEKMRWKLLEEVKSGKTELRDEGLKKIYAIEKINLRKEKYYGKEWFVMEGCTMPDVFIETNKFYMIVEGKRRESGPKIGTTWYKKRHQMVRHLEGLVCYKHANANKPTYGVFIVDGSIAKKYKLERYIEEDPFLESLPHLKEGEEMYDEIKQSFLWGKQTYLTWRQIYDCYAKQDGKKIKYLKSTNPDVSYRSGEYEREEPRFEEL